MLTARDRFTTAYRRDRDVLVAALARRIRHIAAEEEQGALGAEAVREALKRAPEPAGAPTGTLAEYHWTDRPGPVGHELVQRVTVTHKAATELAEALGPEAVAGMLVAPLPPETGVRQRNLCPGSGVPTDELWPLRDRTGRVVCYRCPSCASWVPIDADEGIARDHYFGVPWEPLEHATPTAGRGLVPWDESGAWTPVPLMAEWTLGHGARIVVDGARLRTGIRLRVQVLDAIHEFVVEPSELDRQPWDEEDGLQRIADTLAEEVLVVNGVALAIEPDPDTTLDTPTHDNIVQLHKD